MTDEQRRERIARITAKIQENEREKMTIEQRLRKVTERIEGMLKRATYAERLDMLQQAMLKGPRVFLDLSSIALRLPLNDGGVSSDDVARIAEQLPE